MKRYAAHYLFLPKVGFIKQQVVEITTEGVVQNIFPLKEEIESVEWFPGVIALISEIDAEIIKNNGVILKIIPLIKKNTESLFKNQCIVLEQSSHCFFEALEEYKKRGISLFPFLFYPFDFTSMQPVAGTQHRLLR